MILRKLSCLFLAVTSCLPTATHYSTALLGGSSGGDRLAIIPSSWNVSAWAFDPANGSTCASDNNNCTQTTCGAAGSFQGPCLTYGEILARWGTNAPALQQTTIIKQLTDDVLGDPLVFRGTVVGGGSLYIVGTLKAVTWSGTILGTVVSKNRTLGTATPLTANLGSAVSGIVGDFLTDTNVANAGVGWIYTTNGANVAVLSQPFLSNATPGTVPATPTEVNSYTTGDTYTITQPTKVRILDLEPFTTGANVPAVVLMHVYDSFVGNTSTWNSYVYATESRFDTVINQTGNVQVDSGYAAMDNCYTLGTGSSFENMAIQGGAIGMGGGVRIANSIVDLDVILSEKVRLLGLNASSEFTNPGMYVGAVWSMNQAYSTSVIQANGAVWSSVGAGIASPNVCGLQIASGSSYFYSDTAAETFACNTTTWQLGNTAESTSCSVTNASPAVWNCGITVNVTNLAAAAGASGFGNNAIDPRTGTHISQY